MKEFDDFISIYIQVRNHIDSYNKRWEDIFEVLISRLKRHTDTSQNNLIFNINSDDFVNPIYSLAFRPTPLLTLNIPELPNYNNDFGVLQFERMPLGRIKISHIKSDSIDLLKLNNEEPNDFYFKHLVHIDKFSEELVDKYVEIYLDNILTIVSNDFPENTE